MLSAVVILGVCTMNAVMGCSPPMGWEHKKPLPRLKEADIVITGKIVELKNVTRGNAEIHLLNIEVDCILRNEKNVSIDSELQINEDASGAMCINNMVSVKYNVPLVMSLRYENYDDENEFWFANINVQGAIYDKEDIDPKELVMHCEFVSASEKMTPEGNKGQCPEIPADSECVSGVVSMFVVPSSLVLMSFLFALMNM